MGSLSVNIQNKKIITIERFGPGAISVTKQWATLNPETKQPQKHEVTYFVNGGKGGRRDSRMEPLSSSSSGMQHLEDEEGEINEYEEAAIAIAQELVDGTTGHEKVRARDFLRRLQVLAQR